MVVIVNAGTVDQKDAVVFIIPLLAEPEDGAFLPVAIIDDVNHFGIGDDFRDAATDGILFGGFQILTVLVIDVCNDPVGIDYHKAVVCQCEDFIKYIFITIFCGFHVAPSFPLIIPPEIPVHGNFSPFGNIILHLETGFSFRKHHSLFGNIILHLETHVTAAK